MENINAEFPLEIWENGQPNENFEVDPEVDDEEDGGREDNGTLDGGIAGDETGEKRRNADCALVGLCRIRYTFYIRLVLTFCPLFFSSIPGLVFTVRRSTECSPFSCNPPPWSDCFYWT
jgi:hypothetical protein